MTRRMCSEVGLGRRVGYSPLGQWGEQLLLDRWGGGGGGFALATCREALHGQVRGWLSHVGTYLGQVVGAHLGGSGSCTILLRMLWIWENLGRSPGSFCQQSSISRCRGLGQFLGGGSRKPSSTALITWAMGVGSREEALGFPSTWCVHTHTHTHTCAHTDTDTHTHAHTHRHTHTPKEAWGSGQAEPEASRRRRGT